MVVKTFRGLLAHGGQDQIRLQTIKGKVGYKIIKFQLMSNDYGTASADIQHSLVKITKERLTTINEVLDFTESRLLAAAVYERNTSSNTTRFNTIFDNEIFNQDIFISHNDSSSGGDEPVNYYLELEVIPLTDSDAEFTTLKDIRGRNTTP